MKYPCGKCHVGVYALEPCLRGVVEFVGCRTKEEALSKAPKCKTTPDRICEGAKDWLNGASFPFTEAKAVRTILEIVS